MDTPEDLEYAGTLGLLSASAGSIPSGLSARVFQASVVHLPNQEIAGRIGSRTSFEWKAAAAILILVGGSILAWQTSSARDRFTCDERSLALVLDASASSSGDENFIGLASAQGAGFDDLDFEMRSILRAGQAGR